MALGSASVTVPSISIMSSLAIGSARLLQLGHEDRERRPDFGVVRRLAPPPFGAQLVGHQRMRLQVPRVFPFRLGHGPTLSVDDQHEAVIQHPVHQHRLASIPSGFGSDQPARFQLHAVSRPPCQTTVRISACPSRTATVCSKWADKLPSAVTAVQLSSKMRTSSPPALTIGSMASVIPSFSFGPRPGRPKLGICGASCMLRPMPWPTKLFTTEKPAASTCDCTAWPMSDSRLPATACSMAFISDSSVTRKSFCASSDTWPTG